MTDIIIGAGSVGTVLGMFMVDAGMDIQFIVRPQRLTDYRNATALQLQDVNNKHEMSCALPPIESELSIQPGDRLWLTVKHSALDNVLEQLPETLPKDVVIITCLNGISAANQLRERFPMADVRTMTIMFNANTPAPLSAVLTTKPEVLIDGPNDALMEKLHATRLHVKAGGERAIWGKLLINLNNAIGAVTGATFRDILINKTLTECYCLLQDEAVELVEGAGLSYELPFPLPYRAYRRMLLSGGRLPWWIARIKNGLTAASYPSMYADLKAGRPTEVEQINGEIVRLAESIGRDAPKNRRIIEQIHLMEQRPYEPLEPSVLRQLLLGVGNVDN